MSFFLENDFRKDKSQMFRKSEKISKFVHNPKLFHQSDNVLGSDSESTCGSAISAKMIYNVNHEKL